MRLTHFEAADLNLLKNLYALLEERHVTRAATYCGLSQPAMSRALERLRATFGDELLIRSAGGFERTTRADDILAELRTLLPRLESLLRPASFDPAVSAQRFKIATTDYGAVVVVPKLVAALARLAPNVQLEIRPWNAGSGGDIEVGNVDLGLVGVDAARDFEFEAFRPEPFVCVVARDHPIRAERFTLETYLEYPHAAINIFRGGQPWLENHLAAKGRQRRIAMSTTTAASALLAVARSTMICTIAARMADALLPLAPVRVVAAPRGFVQSRHCMAWHRRSNGDAAQEWLRDRTRDAATSLANEDAGRDRDAKPRARAVRG